MSGVKNEINFTEESISKLSPAPKGKRVYYHDSKTPGLIVSTTDRGVKTFFVYRKIEGRPTRYKLGRYPDLKIPEVRQKAVIARGVIAGGKNPHAAKRKIQGEYTLTAPHAA